MNLQACGYFSFLSSIKRFSRLSLGLGLLLMPGIGQAGAGQAIPIPSLSAQNLTAQVDPNTGYTGVQVPYTSITPVDGKINIRFINETGSAIDYQVIGDTQYRSLAGRAQMTLSDLRTPTTFTFRRADNGFLQVTLYSDSATGTLTLRVRETPDFAVDRTSVYVDQNGGVYLN